ncbi:putative signal transduction protein [Escherichia coli]|nr:putative signal transduction protein [Escherichia coli]
MISVLATQGFLIFMTCILIISKLNHSFVGRVNADPESTRILDCVLDLARKLSISIVAEGVETKEQLDYLNQKLYHISAGLLFL